MKKTLLLLFPLFGVIFFLTCSNSGDKLDDLNDFGTTNNPSVPAVYSKIYGATSITTDGKFVIIKSNGQPDHKSIYYAASSYKYEAFSGTTFGGATFRKNPNKISLTNAFTFKIPLNPTKAATNASTPLGPIGVAINGVPLFNQYAGPNRPLTNEIQSFDQYWGHPTGTNMYHYHVEPLYLTQTKGKEALMGFLLDGFPVYGPEENGKAVTGRGV